jgi:hypothetical protein
VPQHNTVYRVLVVLTVSMTKTADFGGNLERITRILTEIRHWCRCWLTMVDEEARLRKPLSSPSFFFCF